MTSGNIAAAFHRAHRARYGYAQERNAVEVVSVRVRSSGLVEKIRGRRFKEGARRIAKPGELTMTYLDRRKTSAPVYQRTNLRAGSRLRTPCILLEYSATTLITADCRAHIDAYGNVIIEL
jgi:N-methylhydantoinase A